MVLALLLALPPAARAGAGGGPEPRGEKKVRSLLELRQENVVRQAWDLSCGAATLSTLLTFHVGDPVSEPEIIQTILRRADPVRIRARRGFSLLDLKRFAVSRGHVAEGYGKLDLAQLERLAPAIVPTRIGGYNHFVVFRGIEGDRVLLADPAFGNRTMPVEQFEGVWPMRIAFVVERRGEERDRSSLEVSGDAELAIPRPPVVREAIEDLR